MKTAMISCDLTCNYRCEDFKKNRRFYLTTKQSNKSCKTAVFPDSENQYQIRTLHPRLPFGQVFWKIYFLIILRPISEVRTHKQAIRHTIYVCKTLLYEKENTFKCHV